MRRTLLIAAALILVAVPAYGIGGQPDVGPHTGWSHYPTPNTFGFDVPDENAGALLKWPYPSPGYDYAWDAGCQCYRATINNAEHEVRFDRDLENPTTGFFRYFVGSTEAVNGVWGP